MKLYDIDSLRRNLSQDDLYDLFEPTFNLLTGVQQSPFVVGEEEMMRIDLICNKICGSVNEVDFYVI